MMIQKFREYGQEAETRFESLTQSASFSEAAAELLSGWTLDDVISLEALTEAALNGLEGFADKPGLIPLFRGPNVQILAHLWADAADRLHQHDWHGAFQVIQGRSFNARYAFREEQAVEEFALGSLERTGFEVFEPGHIQPVSAGDGLIHSVVYSGKPGLAVSIRVKGDGPAGAVEYLRPGLRCPSHRRRGMSGAQIDLLNQSRQLDDTVHAEHFATMAERLDGAGLLRLLDAAAFDGMEWPDEVFELALDRLPGGVKTLASLADIERSDKTRELLSEHAAPIVRDFICAVFHSDGRQELGETLRIAGHEAPNRVASHSLAAMLVDDEAGEAAPDYVIQALGDAAMSGDLESVLNDMRQKNKGADLIDAHCEFLEMAFEAMEETAFFRCLFRA